MLNNLSGYSLPLLPNGKSALVEAPPWFFGGDGIEVIFRTNLDDFKSFLPEPLEISELAGYVSVTIVDMTSVSSAEMAFTNPERSQYRECLIKLHCSYKGKPGWYVPITWVDKDFSLLRGFIQGFGKKIGRIDITKLHDLNPLLGKPHEGSKIKAVCESFNHIHVELMLELTERSESDPFEGNSMYVTRHYPNISNPLEPSIYELSELVIDNSIRTDIWNANGKIILSSVEEDDEIMKLQPVEIIAARTYKEGFVLHGGRILHSYKKSSTV